MGKRQRGLETEGPLMGGGFLKHRDSAVLGVCFFDASRKSKKTSSFPKNKKHKISDPSQYGYIGSDFVWKTRGFLHFSRKSKKTSSFPKNKISDPNSASMDT